MKGTFLLLFVFLMISSSLFAQEKKTKSFPSKKMAPQKREAAEDYLEEAEKQKDQPLEATKSVEKGLSIALDHNDAQGEIKAYLMLGNILKYNRQYDLAIQNYLLAESKITKVKKEYSPSDISLYDNLAFCYEMTGKYAQALPIRQRLENNSIQTGNIPQVIKYTSDVGFNLWKTGRLKEALAQFQKILDTYFDILNKDKKIEIYNHIGDIYVDSKNTDQAKIYYNKALELASTSKNNKLLSETTDKISGVYRKEKDYKSEEKLRCNQLASPPSGASLADINSNSFKLGELYIHQKKVQVAIPLLENSIKLSKQLGDQEKKKQGLKYLSEAYAQTAQYDKALKFYKKYAALSDSMLKEKEAKLNLSNENYKNLFQQNAQIALLKKDMDLNKQIILNLKKESQLNEANLKRQKIYIYSLVLGMLAMVFLIYFIQKSNKQKRIANQLLALKSLRSQMNPHFIFNSLNSVNHYIMQNDERAANKYLSDFAKLMRLVMENSQEDFVSLNKEIEILTLYMKLEHQRFADKFDYELNIDPKIETDQFMIPPMLVQPYIENAIWHGLRYKEDKGKLMVNLFEEENYLRITIEDNGIGRKKSQELKTKNQKENTSTGMRNTKERVAVMNELYETGMKVIVVDLPDHMGTRINISIARRLQDSKILVS